MSDGRITEVKESSDQALVPFKKPAKPKQVGESQAVVPFKKTTKPKQKALDWNQQAGGSQALVPAKKPAKPKKGAIDYQQAGDSQVYPRDKTSIVLRNVIRDQETLVLRSPIKT